MLGGLFPAIVEWRAFIHHLSCPFLRAAYLLGRFGLFGKTVVLGLPFPELLTRMVLGKHSKIFRVGCPF